MNVPKSMGRLVKNEKGDFIMINRDGQRFIVDPTIGIIWKLCDGKTHINSITARYRQMLGMSVPHDLVKSNIEYTLMDLRGKSLME